MFGATRHRRSHRSCGPVASGTVAVHERVDGGRLGGVRAVERGRIEGGHNDVEFNARPRTSAQLTNLVWENTRVHTTPAALRDAEA